MAEDIQFSNMDSWKGGGKFGLTFKQIVIQHISRCVNNGSVEWHGGYWNTTGNNPVTRTYVQNSRQVYCNSVRMLRACLFGYFDKQMREAEKVLEEDFEELYSKEKEKNKAEFFEDKLELYIKLFEELIMLSKRLNYFEEESSEEEM